MGDEGHYKVKNFGYFYEWKLFAMADCDEKKMGYFVNLLSLRGLEILMNKII